MSECEFCDIISGEQPIELLYEDENVIVIKDKKPAAKFHYLAIPKNHIKDINDLSIEDKPLVENLIGIGKNVLNQHGCNTEDVRIGFHVPPFNSVSHLHLHLIAPTSELRPSFKLNTWWFITAEAILVNLKSKLPQ